jgi:hypothetical protein
MDEFQNAQNELFDAVKAPERKRKPSNAGLWISLIFFNLVLVTIDIISGVTVYRLSGIWFYGLLTILAGAIPLGISEILYTRPFASKVQRNVSIAQALIAFASILVIGVFAAIANAQQVKYSATDTETVMLITIVALALTHAILCAFYFYSDDGILADQQLVRSVADSMRKGERLTAADQILQIVEGTVKRRKSIGSKYNNKAALIEVLKQLGEDLDNDGIPDVLESHGQMNRPQRQQPREMSYAADTKDEGKPPLLGEKNRNGQG